MYEQIIEALGEERQILLNLRHKNEQDLDAIERIIQHYREKEVRFSERPIADIDINPKDPT